MGQALCHVHIASRVLLKSAATAFRQTTSQQVSRLLLVSAASIAARCSWAPDHLHEDRTRIIVSIADDCLLVPRAFHLSPTSLCSQFAPAIFTPVLSHAPLQRHGHPVYVPPYTCCVTCLSLFTLALVIAHAHQVRCVHCLPSIPVVQSIYLVCLISHYVLPYVAIAETRAPHLSQGHTAAVTHS